jgi:hypothetical protein
MKGETPRPNGYSHRTRSAAWRYFDGLIDWLSDLIDWLSDFLLRISRRCRRRRVSTSRTSSAGRGTLG